MLHPCFGRSWRTALALLLAFVLGACEAIDLKRLNDRYEAAVEGLSALEAAGPEGAAPPDSASSVSGLRKRVILDAGSLRGELLAVARDALAAAGRMTDDRTKIAAYRTVVLAGAKAGGGALQAVIEAEAAATQICARLDAAGAVGSARGCAIAGFGRGLFASQAAIDRVREIDAVRARERSEGKRAGQATWPTLFVQTARELVGLETFAWSHVDAVRSRSGTYSGLSDDVLAFIFGHYVAIGCTQNAVLAGLRAAKNAEDADAATKSAAAELEADMLARRIPTLRLNTGKLLGANEKDQQNEGDRTINSFCVRQQ